MSVDFRRRDGGKKKIKIRVQGVRGGTQVMVRYVKMKEEHKIPAQNGCEE